MKSKYTLAIVTVGALGLAACADLPDGKQPEAEDPAAEEATAEWLEDFDQAKAQAVENERPILINFSGSDWCGWCIRLDNEVLDQTEFKEFANDNLVLFIADFPRGFDLPEDIAAQNQALARKFGVQGFPTILLTDADETVIGRTGYRRGGAEAYVAHLRELLEENR